ncbi:hypothetical protein ACSBOB_10115 [Mesorhizobium sp. ASY16-5R]|uniref:hypothetical protein n=1 Tax=Mesorhizobium sp. ASY16-5R TaxID=3445772 RepID=UPI003FA01C71
MERAIIRKSEPPSLRSRFLVGRDAQGCWVVRDRKGLVGGLFTDREAAVHFAMVESDRVPGAVSCAPDDTIVDFGPAFDRPSRVWRH